MKKKFRKVASFALSTLLTVMTIFGNVSMTALADGDDPVAPLNSNLLLNGSGTSTDPYIIEDSDDWDTFAAAINDGSDEDVLTAYYKLSGDIIISADDIVGTEARPFKGHFDGNNNTITAAINDTSDKQGTAPFRYISGATIENVNVGGAVVADGYHAGGLVGFNWGGASTISNCKVSATVDGKNYSGGIVGHGKSASLTLSDCIFEGNLNGRGYEGGLIGWNDDSNLTITNCLFCGNVQDGYSVFSPVALHYNGANATLSVTETYFTVSPSTTSGDYTFGSVGRKVTDAPSDSKVYHKVSQFAGGAYYYELGVDFLGISNTYYKGNDFSYTINFDGTQMVKGTDYTAVLKKDGTEVDDLSEAGNYTLEITGIDPYYGTATKSFSVIDGEFTVIETAEQWNSFVNLVNQDQAGPYYELGADIEVSTIAAASSDHPFTGTFDGKGHTITADITDTGNQGTALFRYIDGTTIRNVNVAGTVKGGQHVAALVGFVAGNSTISNINASANIEGGTYLGGIVGHAKSSILNMNNCVFSGELYGTGSERAYGGIVGWNDDSTLVLDNCLFKGTTRSTYDFHPITLRSAGKTVNGTFTNCYYLNTSPQVRNSNYHLPGTIADKVSATQPDGLYLEVTAADKNTYYVSIEVKDLETDYYIGNDCTLTYRVIGLRGETLVKGTDYTETLTKGGNQVSELSDEGEYELTITGVDPYSGTQVKTLNVHPQLTYMDYNESTGAFESKPVPSGFKLVNSSQNTWTTGWYVVNKNVTIDSRIDVRGDVNLVLCDGVKLSAGRGTQVCQRSSSGAALYSTLTIYGQENNTGTFESKTISNMQAGIGGGNRTSSVSDMENACGTITINGGTIIATGGTNSAGIGGGGSSYNNNSVNGTIVINGGNVTANGGATTNDSTAAGIGGGNHQTSGTIIIRGGKIRANGSKGAKGIGCGPGYSAGYNHDIHLGWSSADCGLEITSNGYSGNVKLDKNFRQKGQNVFFKKSNPDNYPDIDSLGNKTLVPYEGNMYALTIDPNNGSGKEVYDFLEGATTPLPDSAAYTPGDKWTFGGWQIGNEIKNPGDKITLTSDVDVKAVWELPVEIAYAEHGTVALVQTATTANPGDRLDFTVTPYDGYYLSKLKADYVDASGSTQSVDAKKDETGYYIIMPQGPATIIATFSVDVASLSVTWDSSGEPVVNWEGGPDWIDHYEVKISTEYNVYHKTYNPITETSLDLMKEEKDIDLPIWNSNGPVKYTVKVTGYNSVGVKMAYGESEVAQFRYLVLKHVTLDKNGVDISAYENGGKTVLEVSGVNTREITGSSRTFAVVRIGTEITVKATPLKGYKWKSTIYEKSGQPCERTFTYTVGYKEGDYYEDPSYVLTFKKDTDSKKLINVHFGPDHYYDRITAIGYFRSMIDGGATGYSGDDDSYVGYNSLENQTVGELMDEIDTVLQRCDFEQEYRLGVKSSYSGYEEYNEDMAKYRDKYLSEFASSGSAEIYILWMKNTDTVNLTLDSPDCGTQISKGVGGPEVVVDGGYHAAVDQQLWVNEDRTAPLNGTMVGETAYVKAFDLIPEYGYAFSGTPTVRVNGQAVQVEPVDNYSRYRVYAEATVKAEHVYVNNVCTACGFKHQPKFDKVGVLLDGRIGMRFKMELPESTGLDYSDSYMEFSVTGKGGKTTKVNYTPGNDEFVCYVNSIQMAETITAVFHYKDNGVDKTQQCNYSVKEYIRAIVEGSGYDEETVNLVKALADYGHWIQELLDDVRGWQIGTDYAEMNLFYKDTDVLYPEVNNVKSALSSYAHTMVPGTSDVEKIQFSVNFETESAVRVYFYMKDPNYSGQVSATVNGSPATAKKMDDGSYRVEIANINAAELANKYTVELITDSGVATATDVSPYGYARGVLAINDDRHIMGGYFAKYGVMCFYYYGEAAKAYRAKH